MEDRYFLNVKESVCQRGWLEKLNSAELNLVDNIRERYNFNEIICRILAARNVNLEQAENFLSPTLRELMPNPSSITDMDKSASRLARAVQQKEKIAIYGDYDVDGATSCALFYRLFSFFGLEAEIYIPDRLVEGYGPNSQAIKGLIENGANLLILVDCGSTSYSELAEAHKKNINILIFDHHQTNEVLPQTYALVNPNRQDDLSNQGHLCAAGVCYLACVALLRELRRLNYFNESNPEPDLLNYLDLVAMATICDVVPLRGVNRAFVVGGLALIAKQRKLGKENLGLAALCEIAKLNSPLSSWHFGFILGPRINAGGRIGNSLLGARLLISDDESVVKEIAEKLDLLNNQRKEIEKKMLEKAFAEAEIEMSSSKKPNMLMLSGGTEWHMGVVGLLASRLKDKFNVPSFAIAFDINNLGKGSGRSANGIDLGSIIRKAVEKKLLVRGGGHAFACGLSVKKENLGKLRAFVDSQIAKQIVGEPQQEVLEIDAAISASAVNLDFWQELEAAGPYGCEHPRPILAFPHHILSSARRVGEDHVSFHISSSGGKNLRGIAFKIADEPLGRALLGGIGKKAHFVGHLSGDFYQGKRRFQLNLLDMFFV